MTRPALSHWPVTTSLRLAVRRSKSLAQALGRSLRLLAQQQRSFARISLLPLVFGGRISNTALTYSSRTLLTAFGGTITIRSYQLARNLSHSLRVTKQRYGPVRPPTLLTTAKGSSPCMWSRQAHRRR